MQAHTLSVAALVDTLRLSGSGPAYARLARGLKAAVLDGRLPLGARLPGERDLAAGLGMSRTTVTAAYTELRDEGFLASRPGARSVLTLPNGAPSPGVPLAHGPSEGAGVLDLAFAAMPAPGEALARAYRRALEALPAHLGSHGYAPWGLPVLRERVAERFAARGLPTDPDMIVVTSGAQHALHLLLRVLAAPGDRVVVDSPSYPLALDAIAASGCRVVPVPLKQDGWDEPGLVAALRQTSARLAYLIPDFHNPTGLLMPNDVRASVARAAAASRTTLIVDETLADLALDVPKGAPARPLASFDPRAEVVTIGSTSKSCWGGLRLGWIRAPRRLVDRLVAARAEVDLGTPIVEQLAAAALLGDLDAVLAERRATLRVRRDALAAALRDELPAWSFALPPGGLSLWVTLPGPFGSALCALAETRGVRLQPGARFGAPGLFERSLRLPFALPEEHLREAVRRLARLDVGASWSADRELVV